MALYAQVIHSLKFAHRRSSSAVYAASMVALPWAVHVLKVGCTGDSREARESARNELLSMYAPLTALVLRVLREAHFRVYGRPEEAEDRFF